MSQEIDATSGAEGQAPMRIRSIEKFEVSEAPTAEGLSSFYVPCKLYTVEFGAETRRYLVSDVGRLVITKEIEGGFWRDNCATYKCLSNLYSPLGGKWITQHGTILADEKDVNFVDWVRDQA